MVDLFAGKAAISKAFRAKHLNCATLDIAIDPRDELWPHKCNLVISKSEEKIVYLKSHCSSACMMNFQLKIN